MLRSRALEAIDSDLEPDRELCPSRGGEREAEGVLFPPPAKGRGTTLAGADCAPSGV